MARATTSVPRVLALSTALVCLQTCAAALPPSCSTAQDDLPLPVQTQPFDSRIVVVGAGVSGIAAAVSLVDKGFNNVIVLEAEDRIGGRVHTVPFGEHLIDMGAHWVHGEVDNVVYDIANPLGLLHSSGDWDLPGMTFLSNGCKNVTPAIEENFRTILKASTNITLDTSEKIKGSLGKLLLRWFNEPPQQDLLDKTLATPFVDWYQRATCTYHGCDFLGDVSARFLEETESPGDEGISWKQGGYQNLIDLLLKRHPALPKKSANPLEGKILLNTEVTRIHWGGQNGLVETKDGRFFEARHIIVTVSLGVLKDRYSKLFTPRLPEKKIEAIRGLGFGAVGKIYLRFKTPWWPKGLKGINLLWAEKMAPLQPGEYNWEREIIGFFTESSIPNVLCAWLAGDGAKDMEASSDDEVMSAAYRTLVKFAGSKYNISRPEECIRTKWFSNPHFRGSYSYDSISSEVLGTSAAALAEPVGSPYNDEILLFAGEATDSSHYSTVHGALDAGRREAERIAVRYSKTNRTESI